MTLDAALSTTPGRATAIDVAEALASYPDGLRLDVAFDRRRASIEVSGSDAHSSWTLEEQAGELNLLWAGPCSAEPSQTHLLAALEAALTWSARHAELTLTCPLAGADALLRSGAIRLSSEGRSTVAREALWQQPRLWLTEPREPYPLRYTLTRGQRHPLRPPEPPGVVYRRYIPWLAETLSFRRVDLERDLALFHRWMNDPVVAHFWQEQGDLAKHRAYLEAVAADPHVSALIGCFGQAPFGYFEVYWAKEDRLAPYYDAHDFDRGWHALVGEARFRGKPYLTAWMPSISHCLLLDDCRTQRIVIEPRSDNEKMIRSLSRCGYALLKEFDFPHKRAVLGMLLRERFFGEALWFPRPDP